MLKLRCKSFQKDKVRSVATPPDIMMVGMVYADNIMTDSIDPSWRQTSVSSLMSCCLLTGDGVVGRQKQQEGVHRKKTGTEEDLIIY